MRNQQEEEQLQIEGERSSAIERITLRMDSAGGLRNELKADMQAKLTLAELHYLERKLDQASTVPASPKTVVDAVTNARHARQEEERKQYEWRFQLTTFALQGFDVRRVTRSCERPHGIGRLQGVLWISPLESSHERHS